MSQVWVFILTCGLSQQVEFEACVCQLWVLTGASGPHTHHSSRGAQQQWTAFLYQHHTQYAASTTLYTHTHTHATYKECRHHLVLSIGKDLKCVLCKDLGFKAMYINKLSFSSFTVFVLWAIFNGLSAVEVVWSWPSNHKKIQDSLNCNFKKQHCVVDNNLWCNLINNLVKLNNRLGTWDDITVWRFYGGMVSNGNHFFNIKNI